MKLFTRQQFISALAAQNVPAGRQGILAPDEISGDVFATVSRDWVAQTWADTIAEMQANTPQLLSPRSIGGGKTVMVPRYFLNGFCCRGHALKVYAHGMTGFALSAAASPTPLDHDALAWGFLHYTAMPRTQNLNRNGRHECLWGVDHDGVFFTYEPGDGDFEPFLPEELASITLLFAQ